MRRERLYLEDILTAADAIAEFTQAQNLESFEGNRLLRSAVVQQLTVIGEAVAHLSREMQERYPILLARHHRTAEHRRAQLFRDRLGGSLAHCH